MDLYECASKICTICTTALLRMQWIGLLLLSCPRRGPGSWWIFMRVPLKIPLVKSTSHRIQWLEFEFISSSGIVLSAWYICIRMPLKFLFRMKPSFRRQWIGLPLFSCSWRGACRIIDFNEGAFVSLVCHATKKDVWTTGVRSLLESRVGPQYEVVSWISTTFTTTWFRWQ